MIVGVVLAAGMSSRMGSPKALLELEGKSFLALIVDALRAGGCAEIIVVAGEQERAGPAREVRSAAIALGAKTAINSNPLSGQIDSLRAAIASLPDGTTAILSTPVDAPGVTADVVRQLCEASARAGAEIVIPTFGGRRGHPVLFAASVFDELQDDQLPEGARTVIHRDKGRILELSVESSSILMDIDTPDDYQRLLEQR